MRKDTVNGYEPETFQTTRYYEKVEVNLCPNRKKYNKQTFV